MLLLLWHVITLFAMLLLLFYGGCYCCDYAVVSVVMLQCFEDFLKKG